MLTVLNVAYPFAPVSREAVGGAEQVLAAIDDALVGAGQRSIVLGCRGSQVSGELIAVDVPSGTVDQACRERVFAAYREALSEVLLKRSIDLVHFHGVDAAEYVPASFSPAILTLHLPVSFYPEALLRGREGLFITCVSQSQRATCPPQASIFATVENGVDLDRFRPSAGPPGGFAMCLGRICPEKGYDVALRAARRARMTMVLAGSVFPYAEHEAYLAREVVPLLDQRRRFVGPVTGPAKRRLLARARCLVVPSRVAETSSLVAMESLACGTPVVALAVGALPSIVEHGKTGLLVENEAELVQAFSDVREIDREHCRSTAERRFDLRKTTSEYLTLYRSIVRKPAQRVLASSHAS